MQRVSVFLLITLALGCATIPSATTPRGEDPIARRTSKLSAQQGFLPIYWDEGEGTLLMEIPRIGEEMIYQTSLASGVGSNPIGLDRNQLGNTRIIRFERVGPKVLMVQPNQRYRALEGSSSEVRAVEESFASSILWSFKVLEETDGRVLVDATEFFLRDAYGVADRLQEVEQGSFSVDSNRSAIYLPRTRAFPKNTEVEATITLSGSKVTDSLLSSVTPTADSLTVREHHSFVELPEPGYVPRRMDPRVGFFGVEIYDYASPFAGPLEQRFIARHRLQKKDPAAASSEAVRPIIYYVDHAAPEPIRTALLEGALWWKEAFEAAGFHNAFDVKILPADADPLDVRYNVINWVHRSTRGWSYGNAVIDPRTGEILKGVVSLGSLRIRQDVLLASGLIPPFEGPEPTVLASLDPSVSPTTMALARIRQLSAHEVGHTLGLDHNFAASTFGRGSVMDYPAPLVKVRDGKLDLSDAYGVGIGSYDRFAIRHGYSEFPAGSDELKELNAIVRKGIADGMLFVSDEHARDPGTAHPLGAVWDNGDDPIAMLRHEMEVRRIALSQFGLANLPPGQPLSQLEPILLPLYLHHRYQLEAALKSLGGVAFTYAVKDGAVVEPQPVREIVAPERQREALRLAMQTLDPAYLRLPQRIIDLIPPPAHNTTTGIAERFDRATDAVFDPIAAVRGSATISLRALLHPARAARLVRHHAENPANPSLEEVTAAVVDRIAAASGEGYEGAISRAVRDVAIGQLIAVSADHATDSTVRAVFDAALREVVRRLRASRSVGIDAAARLSDAERIERYLARQLTPVEPSDLPEIPPGPPI